MPKRRAAPKRRPTPDGDRLIAALGTEARRYKGQWYGVKTAGWASRRAVADASAEVQLECLLAAAQWIVEERARRKRTGTTDTSDFLASETVRTVLVQLLRRRLPIRLEDAEDLLERTPALCDEFSSPPRSFVGFAARAIEEFGRSPRIEEALRALRRAWSAGSGSGPPSAANRRFYAEIDELLGAGAEVVRPEPFDPWGRAVTGTLEALTEAERTAWCAWFGHARTAVSSKPAKAWLEAARPLVDRIGPEAFVEAVTAWAEHLRPAESPDSSGRYARRIDPIAAGNGDLLKGTIWGLAVVDDPRAAPLLGTLAERTLRKVPGHGPYCRKGGNAALAVLARRGGMEPVQQLQQLLPRVRYSQAKRLIEKSLDAAADRAGLTRADLDDLSVPDFGLDAEGVARETLGDFVAEIIVEAGSTARLAWRRPDGKLQKSVPKAVREAHPESLKALRARVKSVQKTLVAQRHRVEAFWIADRSWSLGQLHERLLQHRLVGLLASRLVWELGEGDDATLALWHDGELQDVAGRSLADRCPDTRARLWHPIHADVGTVLAWRRRLRELAITQPFKQAHREIYVLTEAEKRSGTYSNRFAAHILKQHQLNALFGERGWRYQLQGGFDGYNEPTRWIPERGLAVDFVVQGICAPGAMSDSGISLYVTTDQVRFRPGDGHPALLGTIDPLVFSEVMREIDLFVSVASVGNDPNWADHGDGWTDQAYWQGFAFGSLSETARTRRTALEELLPALSIADRCELQDRFLRVRGRLASYLIHLGSGHVQMEDGSQYLCIVPGAGAPAGVVLPFEGDGVLSLVLSKAFLLARDDRIQDPSIRSQIRPVGS